MRKVTEADKLFYYERNFFTMDGVWMLEIEKVIGWDAALKIDIAVWKRLMKIFFRRIKRYLNIETNTLNDLVDIISFRWSVEGWKYTVNRISQTEITIEVNECPYKAVMDRNEERHDKRPLICKDMCHQFYKAAFEDFNPRIKFERNKFMGLGDKLCDFCFKLMID